jgi:hypothetical protein
VEAGEIEVDRVSIMVDRHVMIVMVEDEVCKICIPFMREGVEIVFAFWLAITWQCERVYSAQNLL